MCYSFTFPYISVVGYVSLNRVYVGNSIRVSSPQKDSRPQMNDMQNDKAKLCDTESQQVLSAICCTAKYLDFASTMSNLD